MGRVNAPGSSVLERAVALQGFSIACQPKLPWPQVFLDFLRVSGLCPKPKHPVGLGGSAGWLQKCSGRGVDQTKTTLAESFVFAVPERGIPFFCKSVNPTLQ